MTSKTEDPDQRQSSMDSGAAAISFKKSAKADSCNGVWLGCCLEQIATLPYVPRPRRVPGPTVFFLETLVVGVTLS